MLTAKGDETDRVVGLELGADDYVAKPFGARELVARLRALLRRSQPSAAEAEIRVADLVIMPATRRVQRAGQSIELTALEFDMLHCLAERAGRVVNRQALLELAGRGDAVVSDRTVDVHISHLRQKLSDDPRAPRLIKTVRGVGYVLSREPPEAG
jgi:DNA-binding response OmpR family regulator